MLSDSELAAIEKRANDASKGPWTWQYEWVERIKTASYTVTGPSEDTIDIGYEEDATFIAHAREDVSVLVAEVRGLRDSINRAGFDLLSGSFTRRDGTIGQFYLERRDA